MSTANLLLAACGILWLGSAQAQETIDWSKARVSPTPTIMQHSVSEEGGAQVLKLAYDISPKPGWGSYVAAPWQCPADAGDGISFEVKGDGSTYYASFFLSYQPNVSMGYEAIFPLASTEWHKVTLRWDELVQNHLPFDAKIVGLDTGLVLEPSRITTIGFGTGATLHEYRPQQYALEVRSIRIEAHIPVHQVASYSKGLARTVALIKAKQPLKILLIGDSITAMYRDRSYGYYLGQELTQAYGVDCQVANVAIGGQTVRYGTIILGRSLATMPDPDLVCIMFGANDCKEVEYRPAFTAEVFAAQLANLIARVRQGTDGKADILLLSGVARLNQERTENAGTVEKIADGIRQAAEANQTGYCDTLAAYHTLLQGKQEEWLKLYKDTIHQGEDGQKFLCEQVFATIKGPLGE